MRPLNFEENISLLQYNTFSVEASARYFIRVTNIAEVLEVLKDKTTRNLRKLVLGGGSNVLFTKNFSGLVIKNEIPGQTIVAEDDDFITLDVGAGENWHSFVMSCVERNYGGIENLSFIPGSVGAGPMQNIGAYGVEIKQVVEEVECIDLASGSTRIYKSNECEFGYRTSIFKTHLAGKVLISRVRMKLRKKAVLNTSYGDIEAELKRLGLEPSVKNVSKVVIEIRQNKLPNPSELGNAGSFFKNPVVEEKFGMELKNQFPEMPLYPASNGKVKLAAGWLIEKSGWKGKKLGNCGVHARQALVLVNYGSASGADILNLADKVEFDVMSQFGVKLEREVNIL